MYNNKKQKFIVIEGCDKSGKTTCSKLLAEKLNAVYMCFPDRSTEIGRKIDTFLKSGFIDEEKTDLDYLKYISEYPNVEYKFWKIDNLFTQNRYEKANEILSILNSGKTVVCDRYWYSGVAYSVANGLDSNYCITMNGNLPQPDFIFFLNVDEEERKVYGGYNNIEIYENLKFQRQVRNSFNQLSEYFITIDVNSFDTPEGIVEKIIKKI